MANHMQKLALALTCLLVALAACAALQVNKHHDPYSEGEHRWDDSPYDGSQGHHPDQHYEREGGRDRFRDWVDNVEEWKQHLPPGRRESDCTAQPADDFTANVFVSGSTFTWTDLSGVDVYPATKPCCWAQSLNPLDDRSLRRTRRPKAPAQPPAAATVKTAAASPADVNDPMWERPVSHTASGDGFLGTYDTSARPTDQALIVAPHPTFKGLNYVVHAIKRKVAIFLATEDGQYMGTAAPGAVSFSTILGLAGPDPSKYFVTDPVGFYDFKEERYVLVMMTYLRYQEEPLAPGPHLLAMVSCTNDPTGEWTVKALDSYLPERTGLYCNDAYHYTPDYPQVSYDEHAVYLSTGSYCGDDGELLLGTSMWAYPKSALYAKGNGPIKAAIYTAAGSFSTSAKYTVNNFIQPAKPQTAADVLGNPLFVVEQPPSDFVVATLLDTHAIESMTDAASAPRLQATVVPQGFTFPAGVPYNLTQYQSDYWLDGGESDIGTARARGATKHEDKLYVALIKPYGAAPNYVPSIYYNILCLGPENDICSATGKEGILAASQDGGHLGLSYPQIVGLPDGGALLMYAFSGAGLLPGNLGPAYAGVATSSVTPDGEAGIIELVKVGDGVVTLACDDYLPNENWCRWGDYTGMSVVHNQHVWFSVTRATTVAQNSTWYGTWISAKPLKTGDY